MKAMILAAGRGERMRPLTDHTPKPLLKVGRYSLIETHLYALAKAGIADVVINCSHLGHQIEQMLGDGKNYGVAIQYSRETQPLETAGGIVQARSLLGDQPFIVMNADIWTDYPIERLIAKNPAYGHLVLVHNPTHHADGDFGLQQEIIVAGEPRYTYAGLAVYHPKLFASLDPGVRKLRPILDEAIAKRQLTGELYSGQWWDVGTPERLEALRTDMR